MQNIERQNIRPQIHAYNRDENHAVKIAGIFYYSSAAILCMASVFFASAILLGFLFSPGATVMYLILALIYGFPGWAWAGVGVVLFCCHKKYYKSGLRKSDAIQLWLGTISFNGIQALLIFNYLPDDFHFGTFVAVWNLVIVSLSVLALYFELKRD